MEDQRSVHQRPIFSSFPTRGPKHSINSSHSGSSSRPSFSRGWTCLFLCVLLIIPLCAVATIWDASERMEFGGGYFQGRVATDSHGTAPTIPSVKWPTKEKRNVSAVSSPAPRTTPSAGKPRPNDKSCVIGRAAVQALGPHAERASLKSLQDAITKAKEGKQSRSLDKAVDAAKANVVSLEASIQALGDADPTTLKVLQDALAKARIAANGAPVGVRPRFVCQVGHGRTSDTSCICGRGDEGGGGSCVESPSCRSSCADAPTAGAPSEHGSRCGPAAASHRRVATELSQWRAGARSQMDEKVEDGEDPSTPS